MKKIKIIGIYSGAIVIAFIIVLSFQLKVVRLLPNNSEVISIVGIFIDILIAIVVVSYIQKRTENRRNLKNYFIDTLKEIQSDYNLFINDLLNGKLSARDITTWFQQASENINEIEDFIKRELSIDDKSLTVQSRVLMQKITSSVDFNNQFDNATYNPENLSKREIILTQKLFRLKILKKIVSINSI